ncbi:MAG: GmrSD restriction endonuclease domain-containing protein [Waterburya sp.]
MKATETNLLEFLRQPKQFVIPIYQRTYSWTLQQCQQLWNDVVKVAQEPTISGHFLGSVVYIEHGLYQVTSLPKLLVIDGQQRLTTISLLLKALGQAIDNNENKIQITSQKINNYFLLNQEEDKEDRYKLLLTRSDKETFIQLIENRELPEQVSERIKENFDFFINQINKNNIDLDSLYSGINRLFIVDISLDRERDNPQLIFESLNSTGLELSQADLIRNYILMDLEPKEQANIYNNYWYPMEQSFGQIAYAEQFDKFIRCYLTIKSKVGAIPNIRDVYNSFKSYVQKHPELSIEEIVKNIYCYSKYFVNIAFEKENDRELKKIIADINYLKVDVAYPFLIEVHNDYINKFINRENLLEIFKLVESYVFRRAICGISTNSMNKTFASLTRNIDKNNYFKSIKMAFAKMTSYKRFPNDVEFCREIVVKDIYNFRNCKYLLGKLENHTRTRELVDIENYTIEHIIPQNLKLSIEWQQDLGDNWEEIQAKYLHTIGNLTLTGHNAKLSDRSFKEKQNVKDGFADSPLYLNRTLAKLNIWNEKEINTRAKTLADIAVEVWSFPSVDLDDNFSDFNKNISIQPEYQKYLQDEVLELFEIIRQEIIGLDISVKEDFLKYYIAYKTFTNFVDIYPQKNRLRIILNMNLKEIDDPQDICKDITGWRMNGDIEVGFSSLSQLNDVMFLIRQAFQKHNNK